MPFDRHLIAPFGTGLQKDVRPWLILDDAWTKLQNVYVYRGRIRKRFGSQFMGSSQLTSRFRIALPGGPGEGITDGAGNATGTVIGTLQAYTPGTLGFIFSIGQTIYTIVELGNDEMLDNVGTTTFKTFNTANGAYDFEGAPINTQIYFYPTLPVMGLTQYQQGPINDFPSYGFDTSFAYVFANGAWDRSVSNLNPIFHGTNLNFFWVGNWKGETADQSAMYVTNFNFTLGTPGATDDPIWWFDGTTWTPFSYQNDPTFVYNPNNLQPYTVTRTTDRTGTIPSNYVQSCLIILPFKNALLLLNTVENNADGVDAQYVTDSQTTGITPTNFINNSTNTQFKNRCRYSFPGSPLAENAWLEPNQVYQPNTVSAVFRAAGAGFIDAATDEAIVSAEFIKDRLIVYFERSTWEIVYTGNKIFPFVWQKLNTELGSQSTFSSVAFDKSILTIGNTGVHACNGSNVERIDDKIPADIFELIIGNNNSQRICGIRDYQKEMVYWAVPKDSTSPNQLYPNQVLVYNYKANAWSYNDDCFTAFGYFEQAVNTTWGNANATWGSTTATWEDGFFQANERQILAGTPEGFVLVIDPDITRNAPSMYISNIVNNGDFMKLSVYNHNCEQGDYVAIENLSLGNTVTIMITQVINVISTNQINVIGNINAAYVGGATLARVSMLNLTSKQWNPYDKLGSNVYLARIDFGVSRTVNGEISVDYYPSATTVSMVNAGIQTDAIMGHGILETAPYNAALYPLEQYQDRLWHPIYFQSDGECIQINMYFSEVEMLNPLIVWEDFQLEGLVLHTQATSVRLQ